MIPTHHIKQSPQNHRSLRLQKQASGGSRHDKSVERSLILSFEADPPIRRGSQLLIRTSHEFSKDHGSPFGLAAKTITPKTNILTNCTSFAEAFAFRKSEKVHRELRRDNSRERKRFNQFYDEEKLKRLGSFEVHNGCLEMSSQMDEIRMSQDFDNRRSSGQKSQRYPSAGRSRLPMINHKVMLKNEVRAQKKDEVEKQVAPVALNLGDIENNSIKPNEDYMGISIDKEKTPMREVGSLSKILVMTNTHKRTSAGCRILQRTMSGGEEPEQKANLCVSMMITPIKATRKAARQVTKKARVLKERRASSMEGKYKSFDMKDFKKVEKIEKAEKIEKVEKSETIEKSERIEKNEKIEVEVKDDETSDKEASRERKKVNKIKVKVLQGALKTMSVMSPAKKVMKEGKEETPKSDKIAAVIARANKRLQNHIQATKVHDKDYAQSKKEHAYKDFMLRLNFSFGVHVKVPTEKTFTAYKYYLGKGNNSIMLKTMMMQRWWWIQVENMDAADINFMWTQLKQNKFVESLKPRKKSPFESLEGSGVSTHSYGSNNDSTFNSITSTDSGTDNESDAVDTDPKSASRIQGKSKNLKGNGKAGHRKESDAKAQEDGALGGLQRLFTKNEIMLMNSMCDHKGNMPGNSEAYEEVGKVRKNPVMQIIGDPSSLRMCNHLEDNFHLANKKALLWNMRSYYEAIGENVFDYLPLTFHVRNGFEDKDYKKFLEYFNIREKEIQEQESSGMKDPKKKKLKNIWIVKPGENTNRGIGIHVCDELSQINELVATTEGNSNGRRTYLIQQYLDRPLLYNKRKFDIRCYILISCINGTMKGYWYQEGYIRTASKEFSLTNVTNKLVHLTNDAVQKKAEDYGKFEAGNKLSYGDFQRYLDHTYNGTINFNKSIYPKIRQLAIDCIKGVYGKIDPYRRENCFEVFGLDFMIDVDLHVWLIEANTNPDINASSPALTRVIPNMVENALRLTLDQMYPPPAWQMTKKSTLPENLLEGNKFELVFDEVEDGPALKNILQHDKGNTRDLILDIVAEDEEEEAEDECGGD